MNMTELNELLNFDRKHLWHPYASMTNPPPVNFAVSAQGTRIKLASGQELLDSISSWWCVCHGHSQRTGDLCDTVGVGYSCVLEVFISAVGGHVAEGVAVLENDNKVDLSVAADDRIAGIAVACNGGGDVFCIDGSVILRVINMDGFYTFVAIESCLERRGGFGIGVFR